MRKKICLFFLGLFYCVHFSVYAQKPTYEIGLLVDHTNPEMEFMFEKLKKDIQSVVGEDAIVKFSPENIYVNNYNLKLAAEQYKTLKSQVDIILAVGLYNSFMMKGQEEFPLPTLILSTMRTELSEIDLKNETSGVYNLTYLTPSGSFKQDLQTLYEFYEFKKVGVVIEKPLVELEDFNSIFTGICNELKVEFTLIPYDSLEDIIVKLDGIDALYQAMSFTLDQSKTRKLAEILIEKGIPSFTAGRQKDVVNGIMATNVGSDSFNRFFRRIALIIESYINGSNFSELPVYIDLNNELTVNYHSMQALGIPIRFKDLGKMNFVDGMIQTPFAQKSYNIKEMISEVLAKNLSLKSGQKDVDLSKQDVKTAKSNYLPSLTSSASGTYIEEDLAAVSGGQNPEFSSSGNITLEQMLFSEGANAQISIQKRLAEAQQQVYNAEELDLIFNASSAYLNTLIMKTNLGIQVQNLEVTKSNLQIAEDNFYGGGSAKTDLLRLRSQKAQNTQSLIESANLLHQSFTGLNLLLNNPLDMVIDIEDVSLEEGLFKHYQYDKIIEIIENPYMKDKFTDFVINIAIENAPEMKQLDYNIAATERSLNLYKYGRFLPTVGMQGQYNHEFSRSGAGSTPIPGFPDAYFSAGVNVSLPIINRNQNNINKQTAIIQKEQLELNMANYKLLLESNIRNAISDMLSKVSNIRLSDVSEAAAKESLELTQTAYSSGAVNIVQLLDAQNNYLNAQLARSNAIYSYLISMLQIERYLGHFFLISDKENVDRFKLKFQNFIESKTKQP